jgi:hypothetical protein
VKRLILPIPPNPSEAQFANPVALARAQWEWNTRVKGTLEDAWRINSAPCGQQISASSFTTNTSVTGTTTGTDLSNVVATLIQILTDKGILSPTITRGATQ